MNIPTQLKYTASHEWIRSETDGTLTIGITDHAQEALGDLVFIELPAVGRSVKAGDACAVVESVKAASDIYAPVDGEITAGNEQVVAAPEMINSDAYGHWLYKMRPANADAVAALLDATAYAAVVSEE